MAQVINTNSLSLLTQNNLNKSQSALGSAIERLSSGLRINSAKDDAAGQAIANRFTANIKGLTQASRNANDGISIAQTTEGALNEINNNLQRVRELTVQSQNGTNSSSDLSSIQDEIKQRLAEIDRVSAQTQFNGTNVLSKNQTLSIQVGANDNETIDIKLSEVTASTLKLAGFNVSGPNGDTADIGDPDYAGYADIWGKTTAVKSTEVGGVTAAQIATATGVAAANIDTPTATARVDKNGNLFAEISFKNTLTKADVEAAAKNGLTLEEGKAQKVYIALNPSDAVIDTATGKATFTLDGANLDAKTMKTGSTANPLKAIDDALAEVDKQRSSLGAVQNRFESAITNLGNTVNNLSAARSRIEDSDYATEVSNMSRAQILQQAGTSVLAQANQTTQNVLSLLR
ncbi:FliC/FljB family flagellin [Citrobacter werkmanii]|uniref:Flagellin n=1 Tax=Citrobacter werkmanii TaxID=67827 RepID=A0AA38DN49_9ENTR|nr:MULTISPECIES: FliC/FljB family flagellin [Citrobacter]EGT0671185.1 FliC/FljB family flagellin [Citrobacter werkmanii]MDT0637107.1 FliC/FljB family flagellin [Citrobacter werkmanii]MEC3944605.1 FliC/FljB family flagellin [Citrobacter werkmanii]TKT98304.1 FliC/FljB family flagellin [Citrobacter sp. TBCS-15]HAT7590742.1 FliC/FljB family flagellin [Citrobacter werkmanii]